MWHLYFDSIHGLFTLRHENEKRGESFESFEKAYDYLESRISGETSLMLHNATGAIIYETIISPLEPELLKARTHWHEIAAIEA